MEQTLFAPTCQGKSTKSLESAKNSEHFLCNSLVVSYKTELFSAQRTNFFNQTTDMNIIDKIESEQLKSEVTKFNIGDSVKVHVRVVEGDKERIQMFAGIVIAKRGTGVNACFTVRRIAAGEGVERVFPVHSPKVAKIEIERAGKVRRAKLHYLRGRKGKQAMAVKGAR